MNIFEIAKLGGFKAPEGLPTEGLAVDVYDFIKFLNIPAGRIYISHNEKSWRDHFGAKVLNVSNNSIEFTHKDVNRNIKIDFVVENGNIVAIQEIKDSANLYKLDLDSQSKVTYRNKAFEIFFEDASKDLSDDSLGYKSIHNLMLEICVLG